MSDSTCLAHPQDTPPGSGSSPASLHRQQIAIAFRPIVRGYLLPAAVYYGLMAIAHYYTEPWGNFLVIGGISAITALSCLLLHQCYTRDTVSLGRLEVTGIITNVLLYANVVTSQMLHFEADKLIYLSLLTLIAATSGASLRVIIPAIAVHMATLMFLAHHAGPDVFGQYIFIGIALLFTSFGMAHLMRSAILKQVSARVAADDLAHHDALTGLPNRRDFFNALKSAFASGSRSFSIGIVDLDGFKPINDTFGHAVGDKVLTEVGRRLNALRPHNALVARLGGDEFAFLLRDSDRVFDMKEFGESVCASLRTPIILDNNVINLSGSVGLCQRSVGGSSVETMFERVDFALYRAKQNQRGHVVMFSPELEAEMSDYDQVERALQDADLHRELYVVYQPQFDVLTRRPVGFEALARWHSQKLGAISPSVFVPAAERAGLVPRLTSILLEKALANMATWPEGLRLSFNLSVRDLMSSSSVANICHLVEASGIDPSRIEFEITETSIMSDFEQACTALNRLRALGARIALDDFGAGYSSFGYIHRLPLNKIKVDRCFVTRLKEGDVAFKIIGTIIDLCAKLDLDCVVEGVETEEELHSVIAAGGRYIQGYYFSKALPAALIRDYVQSKNPAEGAGLAEKRAM